MSEDKVKSAICPLNRCKSKIECYYKEHRNGDGMDSVPALLSECKRCEQGIWHFICEKRITNLAEMKNKWSNRNK